MEIAPANETSSSLYSVGFEDSHMKMLELIGRGISPRLERLLPAMQRENFYTDGSRRQQHEQFERDLTVVRSYMAVRRMESNATAGLAELDSCSAITHGMIETASEIVRDANLPVEARLKAINTVRDLVKDIAALEGAPTTHVKLSGEIKHQHNLPQAAYSSWNGGTGDLTATDEALDAVFDEDGVDNNPEGMVQSWSDE